MSSPAPNPLASADASSPLLTLSPAQIASFVTEILPLFLQHGCLSICQSPLERSWTLAHHELSIEYIEKFNRRYPAPMNTLQSQDFALLFSQFLYPPLFNVYETGYITLNESNLRDFLTRKPVEVEFSAILPPPLITADFTVFGPVTGTHQRIPREIPEIAERTKKRLKVCLLSPENFSCSGNRLVCLFHLSTGDCRNSRCGQVHLPRSQGNIAQTQGYCSHFQRSFDPTSAITCSYHQRPQDCPNGKHVQISVDSFGVFHFDDKAQPNLSSKLDGAGSSSGVGSGAGSSASHSHSGSSDKLSHFSAGGAVNHNHEFCKLPKGHTSVCLFYLSSGDCRNKNARNRPESHAHLIRSDSLVSQTKTICPYWNENAAEQKQGRWCKFDQDMCDRRHEMVSVGPDGAVYIVRPVNMNKPGWNPSAENPSEPELTPLLISPASAGNWPAAGGGSSSSYSHSSSYDRDRGGSRYRH